MTAVVNKETEVLVVAVMGGLVLGDQRCGFGCGEVMYKLC